MRGTFQIDDVHTADGQLWRVTGVVYGPNGEIEIEAGRWRGARWVPPRTHQVLRQPSRDEGALPHAGDGGLEPRGGCCRRLARAARLVQLSLSSLLPGTPPSMRRTLEGEGAYCPCGSPSTMACKPRKLRAHISLSEANIGHKFGRGGTAAEREELIVHQRPHPGTAGTVLNKARACKCISVRPAAF